MNVDVKATPRRQEREVKGEALTHWRRNAAEPSLNVHPPPTNPMPITPSAL
ncbi:hypothetical protein PTKU46_87760 [Paraburkholderia terrae]